jgi:hypothetical protein
MIFSRFLSMRWLIACIGLSTALALSACASAPKDGPESQASSTTETDAQPNSAQLLDGLSQGERQLCVFDSGTPPVQRYLVIEALRPISDIGHIGVAHLVPKLIKQTAALNADALIAYDAVVFAGMFGVPTAFVTGQAVKWHQPADKSCQDMGGVTVETMLQTNRTSSGRGVLPFRRTGQTDAIIYVPLHESGVIMLPTIQGRTPSPETTRTAILKGLGVGSEGSWRLEKDEGGQLQLRNAWRRFGKDFFLAVAITYDASSFEVKYLDSSGLAFDPKTRIASMGANQHIAMLVKSINKTYSK